MFITRKCASENPAFPEACRQAVLPGVYTVHSVLFFHKDLAGHEIVDHDNACRADLGKDLSRAGMHQCLQLCPVPIDQVDTDKEDQLVEPQTDDAQDQIDGELLFSGEIIPAHKDIFHAEQVVDDDRDGKTDHTGDEIGNSDKVADCVQSRVDHKAQGAYHAEFQELLYDFTQ